MSTAEELQIEARVSDVRCDRERLHVRLDDGREISVPLRWYPRLAYASVDQLSRWETSMAGLGIYWPEVDEDLSLEGLLAGRAAPGVVK